MIRPQLFVAGCGFLGLAVARHFQERNWQVAACTHSPESAAALSGEPFPVYASDLADRASVEALPLQAGLDCVIHCASSGRGGAEQYRRVYLAGARNLASVLRPQKLVFTSSTSVYAQIDGAWVSEESEAAPDRETGQILRETEDFVCSHGGAAARLAGLFGPQRSVLLKKFLAGEATIEAGGGRWINQIHRDDAVTALATIVEAGGAGVFNVADDKPLTQREIYTWLAEHFDRPLPPDGPIDPDRKRGWTSKRVSNSRLRALGWSPKYPSFFDAVLHGPSLLP